jgi:hypothetical protein
MHNFFRTLAPVKFDAKVDVCSDGRYAYSYDRTLIFVPALIRAFRVGLNVRLNTQLLSAVGQLEHEGFRNVTHLGHGRYSVSVDRAYSRDRSSFFPSREMSVFSIKPQFDGLIVVAASRYDPAAPYQLAGAQAEIDGTITVLIDRCVEVIQHNALTSETSRYRACFFKWRITSPYDNPRIFLRLTGMTDAKGTTQIPHPSPGRCHE